MSVSFNNIPANIRVPFFWAEVDASQAGYFVQQQRALLVGQMLAAGTAIAGIPILVSTVDQAKAQFGVGSMLADMMATYRKSDAFGEVWCLPLADPAAATKATATLTVSGAPTAPGAISLYITGRLVEVVVTQTDTAATIAAAINAAVNAVAGLPVVSAVVGAVVTLTARHGGIIGNDIDVRLNYYGLTAGEVLPAGVAVAVVAMSGGVGTVDLASAFANLADQEFDFAAIPYTDATSLGAIRAAWDDVTGRWSYLRQLYGHVFSAKRGNVAALQTFGVGNNNQHATFIGVNDSPSPTWQWASSWAAQAATSLRIDPARPLQSLPLVGILPAPLPSRFLVTEAQTLLFSGIATHYVGTDGTVRIQRSITSYQQNVWGQPDPSYLDVETLFTLAYVLRYMRQAITTKFGRHKLADDGTRFGAGQAIVTPKIVRTELIAQYSALESQGLVENIDAFKANLIVERPEGDPNRLDILYPPDLVNQLRTFAVLAQFRLQYPATAA